MYIKSEDAKHIVILSGVQNCSKILLQGIPATEFVENKKSERPIDALAVKNMNHPLTDNFKSRDASASENLDS